MMPMLLSLIADADIFFMLFAFVSRLLMFD